MNIPGFEGFAKHLPDYNEKQAKLIILRLPVFTIFFLMLQVFLLNGMKLLNSFFSNSIISQIEPFIPIINNIIFIFLGTLIAQTGFRAKKRLLAKDPKRAYQKVVKKVLGGISMVFSGLLFNYFPIISPISETTKIFSMPFLASIGNALKIPRIFFGLLLFILGIRTAFRAVQSFGIDSASLVYVYFPDEAKLIDHDIYSVVRHPMYLSVFLIAFGSFFLYFSLYSSIALGITLLSFYRHIFIVEEKELVERFGESYKEYAKDVPALFAAPKNWGRYLKFLKND